MDLNWHELERAHKGSKTFGFGRRTSDIGPPMLLAIDVGNTQTTIGVFKEDGLVHQWRISTNRDETADELAVTISNLFELESLALHDISATIVSSVVPHCTAALVEMARKHLKSKLLVVGPRIKTGMPILYDNPHEVGADRIVNSVAAFKKYGGPVIVVDFGTATTFDVVSAEGEYLGGVITPGLEISAEALFTAAAKLSRVDLVKPAAVIGKNTAASIQSGLIFGFVGLVDTIVEKIKKEIEQEPKVVATGGLASLIAPECRTVSEVDDLLTLHGLKMIYEMNR